MKIKSTSMIIAFIAGIISSLLVSGYFQGIISYFFNLFSKLQFLTLISFLIGLFGIVLAIISYVLQKRKLHLLRNAAEHAIVKNGQYSIEPQYKPLKIFISSLLTDMEDERQVVINALEKFPMVKPIYAEVFDSHSRAPSEIYANKLKDSDIIILLLGKRLSPHSENEYYIAMKYKKPILVFVEKGEWESSKEIRKFLSHIPLSWITFSTNEELEERVIHSISNMLISIYRKTEKSHSPIEL